MPVAYLSSSELAALTQTRAVPVHCICVGSCITDNDVSCAVRAMLQSLPCLYANRHRALVLKHI